MRWKETDKKRQDKLSEKEENARQTCEIYACSRTSRIQPEKEYSPSVLGIEVLLLCSIYHNMKTNDRKFVMQHI